MSRLGVGLVLIFCFGCGGGSDTPPLGTVSGTVKLGEEPLPNATVRFSPSEGGRPSTGVTNDNGVYELKYAVKAPGALIGKHRVTISTASTKSDDQGNDIPVPESVPAKYNVKTELEREVKAGNNEFDFPLEKKGQILEASDDKPAKKPSRRDAPSC